MVNNEHLAIWRQDTPGCAEWNHLNNAGSALPPQSVTDAMVDYLSAESQRGGYELARERHHTISQFYSTLGSFLNVPASHIAYAYSATHAYARALSCIPFETGDVILTSTNDYVSNQLAFMSLKKRWGVNYVRVADQPAGGIDLEDLEDKIRTLHPRLVSVTHVPTNSGLIQDVTGVGQLCQTYGIWYLLDACQSVGQMPLDLPAIGCDFLCGTFRKFLRGPRGAGFLAVSDRVIKSALTPLFVDLQGADWDSLDGFTIKSSAIRFEEWERNYATVIGATACLNYAERVGLTLIRERSFGLAAALRQKAFELPAVRILDHGPGLCAIVTLTLPSGPDGLLAHLQAERINASLAPNTAAYMDMRRKQADWLLRLSPHYYNTEEEIEQVVDVLNIWLNKVIDEK